MFLFISRDPPTRTKKQSRHDVQDLPEVLWFKSFNDPSPIVAITGKTPTGACQIWVSARLLAQSGPATTGIGRACAAFGPRDHHDHFDTLCQKLHGLHPTFFQFWKFLFRGYNLTLTRSTRKLKFLRVDPVDRSRDKNFIIKVDPWLPRVKISWRSVPWKWVNSAFEMAYSISFSAHWFPKYFVQQKCKGKRNFPDQGLNFYYQMWPWGTCKKCQKNSKKFLSGWKLDFKLKFTTVEIIFD